MNHELWILCEQWRRRGRERAGRAKTQLTEIFSLLVNVRHVGSGVFSVWKSWNNYLVEYIYLVRV